jgi:hypothetical protein
MIYLQSIGCPSNASACANAAKNGHLNNIKWLRDNEHFWDAYTCANAASIGRLDILMWCRRNGCPWDYRVCITASENGHHEVLRWAIAKRCPCTAEIKSKLTERNDTDRLERSKHTRAPLAERSYDISKRHLAHVSLA